MASNGAGSSSARGKECKSNSGGSFLERMQSAHYHPERHHPRAVPQIPAKIYLADPFPQFSMAGTLRRSQGCGDLRGSHGHNGDGNDKQAVPPKGIQEFPGPRRALTVENHGSHLEKAQRASIYEVESETSDADGTRRHALGTSGDNSSARSFESHWSNFEDVRNPFNFPRT
ncbi:hypothetical protein MMC25_004747 [Agyrium rufum]|nr:hypothetical protein [Agyrium rufum]